MQGTMPGACRRGSLHAPAYCPSMAWMDNIDTWTGLPVEDLIRMTDKWRKYVHGVANPRTEDG